MKKELECKPNTILNYCREPWSKEKFDQWLEQAEVGLDRAEKMKDKVIIIDYIDLPFSTPKIGINEMQEIWKNLSKLVDMLEVKIVNHKGEII